MKSTGSATHLPRDTTVARTDPRLTTIGAPRGDVLITDLDGDLTLYDPRDDQVHLLNVSAGDIWRLLDGERDVDQVAEAIALVYSASVDEVRPHVVRTVAQFVELDLVRVADAG